MPHKNAPARNVLSLKGIRENNLKNFNLELNHNEFIAITGVSGSGKSTLAFDTIYAEGGRRYIETFSPYTRQFLDRLQKPELDTIHGVRPALALEQANKTVNSRSTVGTVTEINEYLKLVWSQVATVVCPRCQTEVSKHTPHHVIEHIEADIKKMSPDHVIIAFPVTLSGSASSEALTQTFLADGFIRYFSETRKAVTNVELLNEEDLQGSTIYVVIDRISLPQTTPLPKPTRKRLIASIQQAYTYGHDRLQLLFPATKNKRPAPRRFDMSNLLHCESCSIDFPQPKPSMFSFNSPLGACKTCNGFGSVLRTDPALCVPDHSLSIADGAVACWNTKSTSRELRKLKDYCKSKRVNLKKPWRELSAATQKSIFEGDGKYRGISGWFERLQRKQYKMHVRVFISRYRGQFQCETCDGTRLDPQGLLYTVENKTLPQIWRMPLDEMVPLFQGLLKNHEGDAGTEIALSEVVGRSSYLVAIGLGYLTLDRQSRTLSGGEFQRVNLTSILGSRLVHTTLVLDEPTIGLHARDTDRLLSAIRNLQDRGNTVVVVEHDTDIIRAADSVVDLGPGAGGEGGQIVYQGDVAGLRNCPTSITGEYLSGKRRIGEMDLPDEAPTPRKKSISIKGATANNLQTIDVQFPLDELVVLSGVSGSGKSSLINNCLYGNYKKIKQGFSAKDLAKQAGSTIRDITGLSAIDEIILIDQSPVGKTPRSNPATYTKAWDIIRECLAETEAAERLGLSKSAFSFNVDGGRCLDCNGAGYHRVEMQFLADAFVSCESCGGSRFQEQVLGVRYHGKNVTDLLGMSLREVASFFELIGEDKRAKEVLRKIRPLLELGLDYLALGHPLNKLSGGEAQRLKLASYLSSSTKQRLLFILDEPTTGLHPDNIARLLMTFRALIARGHSVLCVEHNLDVIRHADWMIDLGPEGGKAGGHLVVEGVPFDLMKSATARKHSHTVALLHETNGTQKTVNAAPPSRRKAVPEPEAIAVHGARHHNLKNISVTIPHKKLVVVTGVSGSGKSTLAFDIVFAEGQRRYIDCLSPYARQYMKQLQRADVDMVSALPPTIAVSQKTAPPLGVSTIGTTTEVYQYLRLLYSKVGTQHCPKHDVPITGATADAIQQEIVERYAGERIFVFAPVVSGRKGYYHDLFQRALKAELSEARVDGKLISIKPELRLERHKLHWISLLIGSIAKPAKNPELLKVAIEQALLLGGGTIEVAVGSKTAKPDVLSTERVCPKCKAGFRELDPQDFSFRSARGVCQRCGGRGHLGEDGAIGKTCSSCKGARIGPIGRHVYIGKKTIHDITNYDAPKLLAHLSSLSFDERLDPIVYPIVSELTHRLSVITKVGLDYISLDRDASSISGGEAQRLRLARSLGSPLSGVCYVLDEPTIGLHAQDHALLMDILKSLRDAGNTVVVVEHDEDTIRQADHIIDIGPRGGANGGTVVASGPLSEVVNNEDSLTGFALRERNEKVCRPLCGDAKSAPDAAITVTGAAANNLKDVSASFPLGRLTVVAGVSGAGKSSLVHGTVVPAIFASFDGKKKPKRNEQWTWKSIAGLDTLNRMIEIDQSPIGKTATSCPASYLGIFDHIRKMYAMIPEAETRGWKASHFSYNTGKGRCDTCRGRGTITVPMSFLPDAVTPCEVCDSLRYNDETLEVQFHGLSLGELLLKTMSEAREILSNHPKVKRVLDYVHDLGLGYLTLGQPSSTLSGGEAQRLKIARELGSREAVDTLYILDEPTIGLHMVDVDKLLFVLEKLITKGNTVVVIEHNLDIIRAADHLIEVGPGPGEAGGNIIFSGSPQSLLDSKKRTPTRAVLVDECVRGKKKRGTPSLRKGRELNTRNQLPPEA